MQTRAFASTVFCWAAVFLTVLHRLIRQRLDRAADRWREDYRIAGIEGLDLHHLYRAMAWLGEELPAKEQDGRIPFAPRCIKDLLRFLTVAADNVAPSGQRHGFGLIVDLFAALADHQRHQGCGIVEDQLAQNRGSGTEKVFFVS